MEINSLIKEFRNALDRSSIEELKFKISVIENMFRGKPGAGLSSGVRVEQLVLDFMDEKIKGFSKHQDGKSKNIDSDFVYRNIPFSFKKIGKKGGQLALAWSKNPEKGVQRTKFTSSIMILFSREASKGQWAGLPHGFYFVPQDFLPTVRLSKNNKTDSLIKAEEVIKMLFYAKNNSFYVPFEFDDEIGRGYCFSDWHSKPKAV